jgi:hypothetical protein
LSERKAFGFGEIVDFDTAADIEGSEAGVADEVGGCGDAEQAKGEAIEAGVLGPAIVALADGGEKFVGREGQAADSIDFVDEDDDALGELGEEDAIEGGNPTLERAPAGVRAPVIEEGVFEIELLAESADQAVVPLFGREILSYGGEIKNGDLESLEAESDDGANHERRFAHLPGSENIAKLAVEEALVEVAIGLSFDITEGIGTQGAARDEEGRVWFHQKGSIAGEEYRGGRNGFPSSNALSRGWGKGGEEGWGTGFGERGG